MGSTRSQTLAALPACLLLAAMFGVGCGTFSGTFRDVATPKPLGSDTPDPTGSGTPTPGGTATPNPTPTGTPAVALGCRSFQISQGSDGSGPLDSYYGSTAGSGDLSEGVGANGWDAPTPLSLCGGAPSGSQAPLTLAQDVTVAVSLPLSVCLCRQYLAAGSAGTVYCAASNTPLDFTESLNSNNDAQPVPTPSDVEGPGAVAHPGDVRISFMVKETLPNVNNCTPSACASSLAAATASPVLYTTGNATSTVANSAQGGSISVGLSGAPLSAPGSTDCSDWAAGTTKGALAGAAEQQENVGGTSVDVAVVERIAER